MSWLESTRIFKSSKAHCNCELVALVLDVVLGKEFEFLGNFDGRDFVDDVRTSKLEQHAMMAQSCKDIHCCRFSCRLLYRSKSSGIISWINTRTWRLRWYRMSHNPAFRHVYVFRSSQFDLLFFCNFHHPMWKDAYDAFEQKMPPSDMGGSDLKDIPEKRRKRREGGGPFNLDRQHDHQSSAINRRSSKRRHLHDHHSHYHHRHHLFISLCRASPFISIFSCSSS